MGLQHMLFLRALQFIRRVTLLQHETVNEIVAERVYASLCLVSMPGVWSRYVQNPTQPWHLAYTAHKRIGCISNQLTSGILFNLTGVRSHVSTLNLCSMQEVLPLCHSFRSGIPMCSLWVGAVGTLHYGLHNRFICQPSPCAIKGRDHAGPGNMNKPHNSFSLPVCHFK